MFKFELPVAGFLLCATVSGISEHSFAGCETEAKIEIVGLNEKENKILVTSISTGDFEVGSKLITSTTIGAQVVEFDLRNPRNAKVILNYKYDPKFFGDVLLAKVKSVADAAVQAGFNSKKIHIEEPSKGESFHKGKFFHTHSRTFKDPRGTGEFIVKRHIRVSGKGSGSFFELFHHNVRTELVLDKNLFDQRKDVNQSGTDVTHRIFFAQEYLGGLTAYCGWPIIWTYKLQSPYKFSE